MKFPQVTSSNGRPVRIDYPTFSREFSYDQLGRLTRSATCAASTNQSLVTQQKYSVDGQLKTVVGPNGSITVYQYDDEGRLITRMDAEENEIRYEYDDRSNLTSYTDAQGVKIQYEYDEQNRKVQEILPNGEEFTFEYDQAGNLIAIVDAKEQCIEIGYDEKGRVRERRVYDAVDDLKKTISFAANQQGLLASYNDGNVAIDCLHNAQGQKNRQIASYGLFAKGHSYEYGSNGLKKSFTAPDGTKYEYEYDKDNNLTAVHVPGEGAIKFSDYVVTRPGKVSLPNGQTISYQYDDFLRVTSINLIPFNGQPVHELSYSYLPCGKIGSMVHNGAQKSFGYDKIGRLISAPEGMYSYDGSGNRTTTPLSRSPWVYNESNQLLSDGKNNYFYDANGSLVGTEAADDVWTFDYNEEGRLSAVQLGKQGQIAAYTYDPFGRRIQKNVCGIVIYYHYTDEGLAAEYDANGNELRSYGYKPNSLWGTAPLWLKQNGQYFWFLNDRLGTPQKLVDSLGNVVWSANYDSSGQAKIVIEKIENNLRLPGQYFDAETGFHNNFYRYYIPFLGRYNCLDPLFVGNPWLGTSDYINSLKCHRDPMGKRKGQNFYVYACNDPVNGIDPLGLAVGDWWDVFANKERAEEIAEEESKEHKGHNDEGDAMRHAEWNRRMTEELGAPYAFAFGAAHEIDNLRKGYPLEESIMDMHNNLVGISSAGDEVDPEDLKTEPRFGNYDEENDYHYY